jgi:hypothetical protein
MMKSSVLFCRIEKKDLHRTLQKFGKGLAEVQ